MVSFGLRLKQYHRRATTIPVYIIIMHHHACMQGERCLVIWARFCHSEFVLIVHPLKTHLCKPTRRGHVLDRRKAGVWSNTHDESRDGLAANEKCCFPVVINNYRWWYYTVFLARKERDLALHWNRTKGVPGSMYLVPGAGKSCTGNIHKYVCTVDNK